MSKIPTVAKAIAAAVTAFGGATATALTDGHVSADDWVGIVAATLVAAVVTWMVPNRPAA